MAEPQKARVKGERTNVRLQPNSESEVLTNLRKDEVVDVLEEVNGPGVDGKPRPWSKISLPSRVALWIYGPLVDPKSKTVKSESVHLRTGPGKNYSELGDLPRGTKVTVVRELDDWFQIEPPAGLSAYVASSLLVIGDAPLAASPTKPSTSTTKIPAAAIQAAEHQIPTEVQLDEPKPIQTAASAPVVGLGHNRVFKPQGAAKAPVTNQPPTNEFSAKVVAPALIPTPAAAPPAVVVDTNGANAAIVGVAAGSPPPASQPAPIETLAVPPAQADPIPVAAQPTLPAAPVLVPGDPNVPRDVVREGFVRRAWNIQAPDYFELRSSRGEGLMNHLISEDPNIDIKFYLGRQVIITGTEWRDRRWTTPLIKVTAIKLSL